MPGATLSPGAFQLPQPGSLGSRRLVASLLVASVVGLAWALVVDWPLLHRKPLLGALNVLVAVAFTVTAMLLRDDRGRLGPMTYSFFLAGLLWPTNWLSDWGGGRLLVDVANFGSSSFWAASACAWMLYPRGALDRPELGFVLLALVTLPGSEILLDLTSTTYAQAAVPLTVLWCSLVALGVGLLLRRAIRARGIERRLWMPVFVPAVCCALFAAILGALQPSRSTDALDDLFVVQSLLILALPSAFAFTFVSRRLHQAAVADQLARMPFPATVRDVQHALRVALRDPKLQVLFWVAPSQAYVDAEGRVADLPTPPGDRLLLPIEAPDATRLALIVADRQLAPHRDLVAPALRSAAGVLLNARMEATLLASREELRLAQKAAEDARSLERRALERDLHDGAQNHLVALATELAVIGMRATEPALQAAVERVRSGVEEVLEELREIAHGIHPAVLTEGGLGAALDVLTERQPVPVSVACWVDRLSPGIEVTAYYVVNEALTNAIKHARASRVSVRLEELGDRLSVEVSDDGVGGADPGGGGLSGMAARVRALGGELHVASEPGSGTSLRATIPVA